MASMTLTIPDAQLTRVVTAVCTVTGKPVSAANAQAAVREWITRTVLTYETTAAQEAARAAALAVTPPGDPGIS